MPAATGGARGEGGGGVSLGPYEAAVAAMEARVADIAAGRAPELVWLLEHPPLYTSGTSGKATDLLDPRFPIFDTGRGGQITYHGPGQRVAYVMLDLKRRSGQPPASWGTHRGIGFRSEFG